MKKNLLTLTIILLSFRLVAQSEEPVVTGKIIISITEGTFDCDLTLKDIPNVKDYFIRLNSGMNILHFRSKKPYDSLIAYNTSLDDTTSTGESKAYYFADNTNKIKFLPKELQVKYVGKFPVVKDTIENYSNEDWKGNIAFNHNSLRTDGTQSAWYPVIYDLEKDKAFDKVRYDIEIVCEDCSTLYINGSLPINGKSAHIKSDVPQEMALFCGNYEYSNIDGVYILNSNFEQQQMSEFGNLLNSFKKYYESKLKIPFGQATVFINTTPTSRKNAWLFVSYPSIYSIGWGDNGLKSLFNPKIQNWYQPFIAHELGHYYFGNYKVFNSELGDMMSEGFAEYLSLQLTKNIIGIDDYNNKIKRNLNDLQEFKSQIIPFKQINSKSEYFHRDLYVYYYAPIIFTAIEKEIGVEKMWQWLNTILETKTIYTNYEFLISTLQSTIHNDELLSSIKIKYFESNNSLDNAANRIIQK